MKEMPGVLSVLEGSEDAFASVLDPLPGVIKESKTKEQVPQDLEPQEKKEDKVFDKGGDGHQVGKESTAYILASALKESGIDLGEINQDSSLSELTEKLKLYADKDAEIKAESLYGKDIIEAAKMLTSGMSLEDRTEYSKLNVLANHKHVISDDMSDEDKAAVIADSKEVIKEYYAEKLTGKALQRAVDGIDEYDDGFEEEFKTASDYFVTKRDEFKANQLREIENTKNSEASYNDSMKKIIEDGVVFGDEKMSKAEISRNLKNIYEPTEEIEIDGKKTKVSKYVKTVYEIRKNPAMGAKLLMLIGEGLTLDTAKNIGKGDFAGELESKLRGAIDFPSKGNGKGNVVAGRNMSGLKGIIEVIN